MTTIEIDFDVFKVLTNLRASETVTYNDVLRELLKLPKPSTEARSVNDSDGWASKGVRLPNGTEIRANYKGRIYSAKIVDNQFMFDGTAMSSPSQAAMEITKTATNGWAFWECKVPGGTRWRKLGALRSVAGRFQTL